MRKLILMLFLLIVTFRVTAQLKPIRTGVHSFTIQWISFDIKNPGTATIKAIGKGKYSIEGEQRNKLKKDYVTIKGTFEADGRQLYFDGKIVSRVSYINNGQPCESNGPAVFKASGARKYWRLQQMLNCDGISTDYIDIF
ncbi:MAG: hypothetical protein EOP42_23570, partial [Sphingobacteriaceae bacterium]